MYNFLITQSLGNICSVIYKLHFSAATMVTELFPASEHVGDALQIDHVRLWIRSYELLPFYKADNWQYLTFLYLSPTDLTL